MATSPAMYLAIGAIVLLCGAPCEGQEFTGSISASRFQRDKAGALVGYSIGLRAGNHGLVAHWQDVEGDGASQRVFCGFMEDPGTPCPLESSGVHTRAQTLTLGYALPIVSAFAYIAAVVPELTWAYVQSQEVGDQTGRRIEFAKGFPQIGVGVELTTPSIALENIRLRFTGRALLPLVARNDCVDCIRPLFAGVDYASTFGAVLSYSF